jgi:hypothetical protein
MPNTWSGRSTFEYEGLVETGTRIVYGKGQTIVVTAGQYAALRRHFLDRVAPVGTSRTDRPGDSLGFWLQANLSATAIASYVAPILVHEGFAQRVGDHHIRITR